LEEIEMSEMDASNYEEIVNKVKLPISQLRSILKAVQAKAKERVWSAHKTSGELDDRKLIDGLVGERAVFKLREDKPPEPGTPQQKPKRIRFALDCSGSMMYFNRADGRLDRLIEVCVFCFFLFL
jgi:hypothetical protein